MNKAAKPRKATKPITSVMVVRMTPPANAGSIFNLVSSNGRNAPEKAATSKLVMTASAMIRLKSKSENQ